MRELPIVVFEVGINSNGHVQLAKDTIDMVMKQANGYPIDKMFFKFQKREPEVSTPKHMWNVRRVSPKSGKEMSYLDYRREMEFDADEYKEIDNHLCEVLGQDKFFVSVWDEESLYWVGRYFPDMPYIKIPSAHATNEPLVRRVYKKPNKTIISTGGLNKGQVKRLIQLTQWPIDLTTDLTILSCTSTYPCPDDEVNLFKMNTIRKICDYYRGANNRPRVGFSAHSSGILPILMAGMAGAEMIEFHVTLDRTLPGSDHAASIEGGRIGLIMRELSRMPIIMGNGKIEPSVSELAKLETLR